jgi:ribosomal protein S20
MTLELKPKDQEPSAVDQIKKMLQGLKDTTQSVQAACLQQIMGLSMKRQTLVKMQSEVSKADSAQNDDYFTPALKVFDEQIAQQKKIIHKNKHLCENVVLKRI